MDGDTDNVEVTFRGDFIASGGGYVGTFKGESEGVIGGLSPGGEVEEDYVSVGEEEGVIEGGGDGERVEVVGEVAAWGVAVFERAEVGWHEGNEKHEMSREERLLYRGVDDHITDLEFIPRSAPFQLFPRSAGAFRAWPGRNLRSEGHKYPEDRAPPNHIRDGFVKRRLYHLWGVRP